MTNDSSDNGVKSISDFADTAKTSSSLQIPYRLLKKAAKIALIFKKGDEF